MTCSQWQQKQRKNEKVRKGRDMTTATKATAEIIQTVIQVANAEADKERARLGRELTADEVGRIAEDVQRIAKSAAVAHGARSSASMTQDRRLSGYNYARS